MISMTWIVLTNETYIWWFIAGCQVKTCVPSQHKTISLKLCFWMNFIKWMWLVTCSVFLLLPVQFPSSQALVEDCLECFPQEWLEERRIQASSEYPPWCFALWSLCTGLGLYTPNTWVQANKNVFLLPRQISTCSSLTEVQEKISLWIKNCWRLSRRGYTNRNCDLGNIFLKNLDDF